MFFLLFFSFIGLLNAIYLTIKQSKKHTICFLKGNCHAVTESKWYRIFYFRNEVWGILFFSVVFLAGMGELAWGTFPLQKEFIHIFTLGGSIFSLFLVYLQIKVIKSYCLFCFLSAIITFLLFAVSVKNIL